MNELNKIKKNIPVFCISIILIILLSISVTAQEQKNTNPPAKTESSEKPFQLTWIDLAFVNFYSIPKTRMADFSDSMLGMNIRLNFMVLNLEPLWLFTGIMLDGNLTNSIRLDRIIDFSIVIGLGWRFNPKPKFFITPKISYGAMIHFAYGDYYNDPNIYPNDSRAGKKRDHVFSDQIFHYELEFAYDVSPKSKSVECEVFISPGFIHFVEEHRQGLELGYMIGARFRGKSYTPEKPKEVIITKTAFLAGRVVDLETGLELKDAVTVVSDEKVRKGELVAGETFSYIVEAGKNYTVRAEREGYDTYTYNVDGSTLLQDRKSYIVIPLKLARIWGLTAHVFDKDNNEPINGVDVTVTDTAGKILQITTSKTGDFRIQVQSDTDYTILMKKRKYFTVRGEFTTKWKKPGWYDIKEFMKTDFQKVVIGATIEFGNIYYDSGSWTIRADSVPGLDKMALFLLDNPTIVVELGAHTDSMGDAQGNQYLSQQRAQSGVNYLITKGIPATRITAMGYGETKLKNRCADGVPCSAQEHQENRRTELKVKDIL